MQVVDLQKKVSLQSNKLSQSKADQNSRATHARMSCHAPLSHDLYQTACRPCAKQHELGMTVSSQQPVRCLCKGLVIRGEQLLTRCPMSTLYASLRFPGLYLTAFCCQSAGSLKGYFCAKACSCKQQPSVFKYRHDSLVCRICMYPTL